MTLRRHDRDNPACGLAPRRLHIPVLQHLRFLIRRATNRRQHDWMSGHARHSAARRNEDGMLGLRPRKTSRRQVDRRGWHRHSTTAPNPKGRTTRRDRVRGMTGARPDARKTSRSDRMCGMARRWPDAGRLTSRGDWVCRMARRRPDAGRLSRATGGDGVRRETRSAAPDTKPRIDGGNKGKESRHCETSTL
jgi:hypothetical protein